MLLLERLTDRSMEFLGQFTHSRKDAWPEFNCLSGENPCLVGISIALAHLEINDFGKDNLDSFVISPE